MRFDDPANLDFREPGLFADRSGLEAAPSKSLQGGLPCLGTHGAKVQMRRRKHGRIPPSFKGAVPAPLFAASPVRRILSIAIATPAA
jgi:hypothetical protein